MSTGSIVEICSRVGAFIRGAQNDDFGALALDLFRSQFAYNASYRRYCERSGKTPSNVRHWCEIPAMITSAFKDLELTVLPASARTAVFHSSGTTEQRPSRHFHSPETMALYEQSLLAWFQPHIVPDIRQANFLLLSPPAAEVHHSSLAHMFATVSGAFGIESRYVGQVAADGSWLLQFDRLEDALTTFKNRGEPVIICGTAFGFVHWLDHLAINGNQVILPPGSRVFETGGYKGRSRAMPKAELHRELQSALGLAPVYVLSEYGMSELSSQAYDRVAGEERTGPFRFPHWARAMIVSAETGREVPDGETGLVRVYDLANASSVLAVQTEDLAIRRGDGFELIGRAAAAEPRGCSLLEVNS